jgi:hypothetical protein
VKRSLQLPDVKEIEFLDLTGYCPIVPVGSIRISFQHRPMRTCLVTAYSDRDAQQSCQARRLHRMR